MSRPCSICLHAKRGDADKAILRGDTVRVVAERLGVGTSTVQRHKTKCLSRRLEAAAGASMIRGVQAAIPALDEMRRVYEESVRHYEATKAREDARPSDITGALREMRASLVKLGEATGEFKAPKMGRPAEVDSLSDAELAAEVARLEAEERQAGKELH